MQIYDFIVNPDINPADIDQNKENFIIASSDQLKMLSTHYDICMHDLLKHNADFPVYFKPGSGFDIFTFVYFQEKKKRFCFETISVILIKNNLIVLLEKQNFYEELLRLLAENHFSDSLFGFFSILDTAFSEMFSGLCRYEDHLNHIETALITESKQYRIKEIIAEKNACLTIKKYAKLLLYSSEDLKLNQNNLIPDQGLRLLNNIDGKIHLIHEMSDHLYEMCRHLLDVYDSAVGTKTNNAINKLTVFSFFATPITIISGIYGMNFINMPELSHPYGYFIVLGIMIFITIVIYAVLKKIKLL